MRGLVLMLALWSAGCASVGGGEPSARCLPDGLSPTFFTWPVVGARTGTFPTDAGGVEPITLVRYQRDGAAVVVAWSRADLLMVDPAPDRATPEWIDTGLLTPDGQRVRATPGERCRWRRMGQAAAMRRL
ncbi:MAG: hypothetical protein HY727_15125 [Candidatus Rokubacteria bacterium]|nr:hypothetical protein [Candidatus Rokubacteria bacterium]